MITTAEFLRVVAALIVLAAALVLTRAISGVRRARTAAYYSTRREAQRTANRRLSTSITLIVIATGLFVVSAVIPSERPEPAPQISIVTATAAPPAQPTVYIVPTSTPTVAPATNTPAQTPRPTAARIIIPTKSPATEAADKHMTLRAISSAVDSAGAPISPTTEFSKGVATLFVFYAFRDVPDGTHMRQTWYRDGSSVYFDSSTWSRSGVGNAHISWSPPQGFQPGLYEVRIMLGNIKQFSANFIVR